MQSYHMNLPLYVQMKERKISGYKGHDAHFILQFSLQFTVVKILKPEVAIPLMGLSAFLRGVCGIVIELYDADKLQEEIIEIFCELEMIFPPAFSTKWVTYQFTYVRRSNAAMRGTSLLKVDVWNRTILVQRKILCSKQE